MSLTALLVSALLAQPCAAEITAGSGRGWRESVVEVPVTGVCDCPILGFSFALGHDANRLDLLAVEVGPFFQAHAGADLVFAGRVVNPEGYGAAFCLFDASPPLSVPEIPVPADTVLATFCYVVREAAPAGRAVLANRHRTFGARLTVSNIFAGVAGRSAIYPALFDGWVDVLEEQDFRRGDVSRDGNLDLADVIWLLYSLFGPLGRLPCDDAGDANDDGQLDLADAITLLLYLFQSGAAPPAPGPTELGQDPTVDTLTCRP